MSASNQSGAELQFPPPPTTADTKSDPAATLTWLKARIATVYQVGREKPFQENDSPKLARAAYLDFYSTAFNYCHITKITRGAPGTLNGGDLYRALEHEIRAFCAEARGQILAQQDKGVEVENARHVEEEYELQWRRLRYLACMVSNLLQPLERDWVQREIAEKRKGVHLIRDLHAVVWKEAILQFGVDSTLADSGSVIARAVATLRGQREEGSASGGNEAVEKFVEDLRTIGVRLGETP